MAAVRMAFFSFLFCVDLAIVPASSRSWLAGKLQWNENIITRTILTITSQNVCFMKKSIADTVCRLQTHLFCTGSGKKKNILTGANGFQVTQRCRARSLTFAEFCPQNVSEPSCLGKYKGIPLKRGVGRRCCIF